MKKKTGMLCEQGTVRVVYEFIEIMWQSYWNFVKMYFCYSVGWNYLAIPKLQSPKRRWLSNFIPHFIMDMIQVIN